MHELAIVKELPETAIEVLPALLLCKSCGKEFRLNDNIFICPECSSSDIRMKQEREIYLKNKEGE